MSSAPIFFEFETREEASTAQSTLEELGYEVGRHDHADRPTLHLIVEGSDLTSALEIAQASGGQLVEAPGTMTDATAFALAYDGHDMIPIPAHIVNDEEADYTSSSDYVIKSRGSYNDTDHEDPFDPSRDEYNHFDPGVHV